MNKSPEIFVFAFNLDIRQCLMDKSREICALAVTCTNDSELSPVHRS